MPRKPELTERDRAFLDLLARSGVLSTEQAAKVYQVKGYHLKRLQVLEARKYIVRYRGYVEIARRGLLAVRPNWPRYRLRDRWQAEHKVAVAELYFQLLGWDFRFGLEVKRSAKLGRWFRQVDAVVSRGGISYAVYLLTASPQEETVRKVQTELRNLPRAGLERAVIFCAGPEAMRRFGDDPCGLKSCLLLPYPYGIEVLRNWDEIYARAAAMFPGFVPSERPFADFERNGTYVSVVAGNDLVKRKALTEYLTHVREKEGRECVAVCLPGQETRFAELFPGARIVVLRERRFEAETC